MALISYKKGVDANGNPIYGTYDTANGTPTDSSIAGYTDLVTQLQKASTPQVGDPTEVATADTGGLPAGTTTPQQVLAMQQAADKSGQTPPVGDTAESAMPNLNTTQVAATQQAATTAPATTAPATTDNSAALIKLLQDLLNATPAASTPTTSTTPTITPATTPAEAMLPASSTGEITQDLLNKVLQSLNATPGYTDAQKAEIEQAAMTKLNANDAANIQQMENLSEKYGWRQGDSPTLGGQARSMFGTYYGQKQVAASELEGTLAQQFMDQYNLDKQSAIDNAVTVTNVLYNQQRGDVADMLSIMQQNNVTNAQQFDQTMQLMGYQSDQDQQNFLNSMAVSQANIDEYFKAREMGDTENLDWLTYLQNSTQVTPDAALAAATSTANANTVAASEAANATEGDSSDIGKLIGMLLGNGTNGTTTPASTLVDAAGNLVLNGMKYVWNAAKGIFEKTTAADTIPAADAAGSGATDALSAGTSVLPEFLKGTVASVLTTAAAAAAGWYGAKYLANDVLWPTESNQSHAIRLAGEYYGEKDPVVSSANNNILVMDTDESSEHHRSEAIRIVDLGFKQAVNSGKTGADAWAVAENYIRTWLQKDLVDMGAKGWDSNKIENYIRDASMAFDSGAAGDPSTLYFGS